MRKRSLVILAVATIAAAYLAVGDVPEPEAADHADAPAVSMAANALADCTDLFAFTSNEGATNYVNFAMNVSPNHMATSGLDDNITYEFVIQMLRVESGALVDPENFTLTCTSNVANFTCQLRDGGDVVVAEEVDGTYDNINGIAGDDMLTFAGIRNDPFYFNLDGFSATATAVNGAAAGLTFNANNCPTLTDGTADLLAACITTSCDGGLTNPDGHNPSTDAFAGQNVMSLVVAVDRDVLNPPGDPDDNPVMTVYGTTTGVNQIDRCGRPAISTALIDPFNLEVDQGAVKDQYNQADDSNQWGTLFTGFIEGSLAILDSVDSTSGN